MLLQVQENERKCPVSFTSRSLNDAEQDYAVMEKEALAATWAAERFHDYLSGLDFVIETDHKPLVPLLHSRDAAQMVPRVQRFKLRLTRYNPTVIHVSGNGQITADALSRAPMGKPEDSEIQQIDGVTAFAKQAVEILPNTTAKLTEIKNMQKQDNITAQVRKY